MEPITNEVQELLYLNKLNSKMMCVGDTFLADAAESGIDDNWCLLNNQSTLNAFINGKYLSNIIYAPDGKYLHFHCNKGVSYTKNIDDLSGYSNTIC